MVSACVNVLGPAMAENRQQIAKHERTTGGAAFYRVYGTSDDRFLTLAGQEEKFVRNLLDAVGRGDLSISACKARAAPSAGDRLFRRRCSAQNRSRTGSNFYASLDVCFGPVQTFPEMLADPQLQARGMIVTDGNGRKHIASADPFRNEPAQIDLRVPALGTAHRMPSRAIAAQ